MKNSEAKSNYKTVRIMAALAFAVIPAAAVVYAGFEFQPGAAISGSNPAAVIRITAVGRNDVYDTVAPQENLSFLFKVRGSCDDGWKVQTAIVNISGEKKAQVKTAFLEVNNTLATIGYDNGKKWSFQGATIPYISPAIPSPVAMCNAEVERRIARGDSKTEVLSNVFDLPYPVGYSAELSVQCGRKKHGFYESQKLWAETKLPVTISCQPTDFRPQRTVGAPKRTPGAPKRTPTPTPRLPIPEPPVESVTLVADPLATTGRQCPAYVNFRGKIQAGGNSTYQTFNTKYRFVGDHGYQTPWTFVSIDRNEPRTVNGRRFIEAPTSNRAGTVLAPGEKPRIPLYRGWTELEVLLPNGSIRSERASFTVDCNVGPARPRIKA